MSTVHIILLSLSLLAHNLSFLPLQTWSFTGTVTEIRQVYLLGKPTEVAKVQSADFYAWVILRMDEGPFEVVLGSAKPGERVRVSIQGAHVSKTSVNWNLCQPADSNYCRLGSLYDAGPFSLDWNEPMSPSNEFIHYGHPNPSWEQALFWKTEKLNLDDDNTPGSSCHQHQPGTPKPARPGCLALRAGSSQAFDGIATDGQAGLSFLVEGPIARGTQERLSGRNFCVAERVAYLAGRIGVPLNAFGNLLAGDLDQRFLQFSH